MKSSKLAGWTLLVLGLVIIIYTLIASYSIFTGQKEIYALFPVEESNNSSQIESSSPLTEQIQTMMKEQLAGVIPPGSIPKLLNLISWSVLASILVMGGGKISGLGVKLITTS